MGTQSGKSPVPVRIFTKYSSLLVASVLLFVAFILSGCSCCSPVQNDFDTVFYKPSSAGGFEIVGNRNDSSRVIRVFSPWQQTDSSFREIFLARNGENPPKGFRGCVLEGAARRIAVTSTSHIALLDLLGAADRIVAASGKRFAFCNSFRERLDSVTEIGPDYSPDYEALISSRADIVLLYGISSESPLERKLSVLGIPYIYIGEYLETSPLGRSEWVVALGELLGMREAAQSVFSEVERKYSSVCRVVAGQSPKNRPRVMLNSPFGDSWFLPSGRGFFPRMIEDAAGEYVLGDCLEGTSVPVSLEKAFSLASSADCWLNVSGVASMEQFLSDYPVFAQVPCVSSGRVFANDKRLNPFGGNDFWESSAARPDLLLADLVRILHPSLSPALDSLGFSSGQSSGSSALYYYRKL